MSYNTRELLRACLSSVRAASPPEVVVVDHGSRDGSPEMVSSEFPQVRLIARDDNPGYGAGANRAIAATGTPYVLLLNADTRLDPGALEALSRYLDANPRAGIVGPRLRNPDGTLQPSCHHDPTPLHIALRTTVAGRLLRHVPLVRHAYLPTSSHAAPRRVAWVVGAVLAIRREAFDAVGGFDPEYRMYFEEVDLCYRIRRAGWEVHFAPVTDVVHVEGASTAQVWAEMQYRLFANAVRFHSRHSPPATRRRLHRILRAILMHKLARHEMLLFLTRGDQRDTRLGAEIRAWRRALRELEGTPGPTADPTWPPAPAPLAPAAPGRADWRLLLPTAQSFEHLAVLGGPPGITADLAAARIARRVTDRLDPAQRPDAVALMIGMPIDPVSVVPRLAPHGALYFEVKVVARYWLGLSLPCLKLRLRARGVQPLEAYVVLPGLHLPRAWLPLNSPAAVRWYLRTLHTRWPRTERLALLDAASRLGSGALGLLMRYYVLTAVHAPESGFSGTPLALRAWAAGDGQRPTSMILVREGWHRTVALPFRRGDDEPALVLKIPDSPELAERTVREHAVLREVRDRIRSELQPSIPEPLGLVTVAGVPVALESYVRGVPIVRSTGTAGSSWRRRAADLAAATEWLADFHATAVEEERSWSAADVEAAVERPWGTFAERLGLTPEEERLRARTLREAGRLTGLAMPRTWQHRDYTPWNVVRGRDGVGVVDWEGSRPGLPLCDLLHFGTHWAEHACRVVPGSDPAPILARVTGRSTDRAGRALGEALRSYLASTGVDPRFVPIFLVQTWVELVLRHEQGRRERGVGDGDPRPTNPNLPYVQALAADVGFPS